jgi:anti-anti-sigma regulatory factor
VLDLERTTYLASAGVGMILQLAVEAAARRLQLHLRTVPGTPPARVLELAGIEDRLIEGAAGTSKDEINS